MKRGIKIIPCLLALLLFISGLSLYAQVTTGSLRGFVTDKKEGEALPGVTVELQSPNLMTPRATVTDVRGAFRFLYLPPGTYVICTKLEGFGTCWQRGVPVQIGKTSTANIEMEIAGLEETIVVTAEAPLIDIESSSKSYNVNLQMLATIPIAARMDFNDVWHILPGVSSGWGTSPAVNAGNVQQSNLGPGGDFLAHHNQDDSYENKILIDGMEANDAMSGGSNARLNYEAIEEIDVKTAGAPAEYGNARSSFMNIVTKAGGNQLEGTLLFWYQPESFNDTNVEGGEPSMSSYAIPAITLSGPIMKNKLWFLLSYKYDNRDYVNPDTVVVKKIVEEWKSHMPNIKLTFQPHARHTISVMFQYDKVQREPRGFPDVKYSTLDAGQYTTQGGPMMNLTWRWIISDSLYFNFNTGFQHKPSNYFAYNQVPLYMYTERFQGGSTVLYDVGRGEDYYSVRENILIRSHLTYFKDNLFNTGSHEIKFGVDIRPYQHVTRSYAYWEDEYGMYQYRLGMDYENYGLTEPYIYRAYDRWPGNRYDNEVLVSNQNAYIQDSWNISKDLTLHLGLRWEHQRENMYFRDELPEWMEAIYPDIRNNIEFDDSGLAPRFGLTYNWKNVGVLKFHMGRYFEYVGAGDYNNYSRTITSNQYRMDKEDIGKGPEALKLYSEGTLGHNPDYNEGMEMEYNDEFVVSIERELFTNLAFETTFIYKKINSSYQEDINAIFEEGKFVDRKFPTFDTIWRRTFYKGEDRRMDFSYKGLQFNLKRNFVGRWGLMVNYSYYWRTYKKIKFDPTDPNQFVYPSPNALNMDNYGIRWTFHFSAFYRFPWDILVSTFINGQAGIFISDRTGDYEWDESAPQVTISNGRRVSDIIWAAQNYYFTGKKWGAQGRYSDDIWSVNLRLSKGIRIDRFRVEFAIDVYNAFNAAGWSSFYTNDIRRTDRYDMKTNPQSPRAAQLSLKVQF